LGPDSAHFFKNREEGYPQDRKKNRGNLKRRAGGEEKIGHWASCVGEGKTEAGNSLRWESRELGVRAKPAGLVVGKQTEKGTATENPLQRLLGRHTGALKGRVF